MRKFDFVIGNPAYQAEAPGESTSDKPIYHMFIDESYKIGDVAEMITPARFLFNAGGTPKEWNKKMLESEHVKILLYEPNAKIIFPNTVFTGGVAVTYFNAKRKYKPIGAFIPYPELTTIKNRVLETNGFVPFSTIISGRTPYLFTETMHEENPKAIESLSKGHWYDLSSNAFESLPEVFLPAVPENERNKYYRVLGRLNNARSYLWIKRCFVRGRSNDYLYKWKVFLPKANGASGMLGDEPARLISKPVVGSPEDIATDTFLCVGAYDTEQEAGNLLKYINTKFARVMLGILKITQDNTAEKWMCVPLQDYSSQSDIDWNTSIANIDRQLYKKYGLSQEEIDFIETHVKEMT